MHFRRLPHPLLAASALMLGHPAASVAAPAATSAPAARPNLSPALWVVKDEDTTIYLFGTVHLLNGAGDWLNDEVKTAFDKSDKLYLEVLQPKDPSAIAPVILKYAIAPAGPPLSSQLPEAYRAKLAAKLKANGLPENAFDRFRPFYAALTLTILGFQKQGLSADDGAEKVLTAAAVQQGKAMGELESIDFQMRLFSEMSQDAQIKMLEQTLDESSGAEAMLARAIAAWGRGQSEEVASELFRETATNNGFYKAVIVNRNKNWAKWIEDRLKSPGTIFIAVGAGHLGGPDSVQRQLRRDGVRATRVPPAAVAAN